MARNSPRYRVIYREADTLLEELADATLAGTRKDYVAKRLRAQMRTAQPARESADRFATRGRNEINLTRLGRHAHGGRF